MIESYKNYSQSEKKKETKSALKAFSKESNEIKLSVEDTKIAKSKLTRFMSTGIENSRNNNIDLSGYHFDTVNRGPNVKPHPEMVIEETKSLSNGFQDVIDSYLKSNPAKIKELQVKLNEWINYGMMRDTSTGLRRIYPIDLEMLKTILNGTGMELTTRGDDGKDKREVIREDGMLGPQTFAVLCCFMKEYRNSSTRNTGRGTGGR